MINNQKVLKYYKIKYLDIILKYYKIHALLFCKFKKYENILKKEFNIKNNEFFYPYVSLIAMLLNHQIKFPIKFRFNNNSIIICICI